MTSIPITLGTAGIMGLILLVLSVNVSRLRMKTGILTGAGNGAAGAESLAVARSMHGNFTEYVPLVLLLMGGIEAAAAPRWLVLALGVGLVVARLSHPVGMTMKPPNLPRAGGALLTSLVLAVAALTAVVIAF